MEVNELLSAQEALTGALNRPWGEKIQLAMNNIPEVRGKGSQILQKRVVREGQIEGNIYKVTLPPDGTPEWVKALLEPSTDDAVNVTFEGLAKGGQKEVGATSGDARKVTFEVKGESGARALEWQYDNKGRLEQVVISEELEQDGQSAKRELAVILPNQRKGGAVLDIRTASHPEGISGQPIFIEDGDIDPHERQGEIVYVPSENKDFLGQTKKIRVALMRRMDKPNKYGLRTRALMGNEASAARVLLGKSPQKLSALNITAVENCPVVAEDVIAFGYQLGPNEPINHDVRTDGVTWRVFEFREAKYADWDNTLVELEAIGDRMLISLDATRAHVLGAEDDDVHYMPAEPVGTNNFNSWLESREDPGLLNHETVKTPQELMKVFKPDASIPQQIRPKSV